MYAKTAACVTARRTRSRSFNQLGLSRWLHRLGVCVFVASICCWQSPAQAQDETSQDVLKRLEELWVLEEPTEEQLAEMDELLVKYEALLLKEQEQEKRERKANEAIKKAEAQKEQAEPTPKQKPTRPTRTSRRPRPTPKPVTQQADDAAADDAAKATPPPRRSAQRPTRRSTTGRPSRGPQPATEAGVTPNTELNEYAENILKDFRDRKYSFSIKEGTYVDLIESFSRMSGLGVVGDAPDGTVNFVSSEEMDFKSALARIQILLFKHPGQYWILLQEMQDNKYLEITRVTDIYRVLPLDRIYPTLTEYQAANLDENELALLLYTPESGTVADIEFLRDFMPDYVRIAQHGTQNALTIFGLVRDINKYLALVDKFRVSIEDPRQLVFIPVEHILPSEALELLKQLMDGFDVTAGAPARSRRAGQPSVAEAQAESITAVPFDDHAMLLVKAMPPKIEEIKLLLPYVDLPLPGGGDPVIVEVNFGTAAEIVDLVRRVMSAADSDAGATSPRRASSARRRARAKAAQPTQPTSVAIDSLTMIDWPPTNSIILIGPEADIERAKTLIARFDVPSGTDVVVVTLEHRDANEFGPQLTQIMQSMRPTTASTLSITPDAASQTLTLAGPQPEIDEAMRVIEKMDVQLGDELAEIHIMVLKHVKPSTLVPILSNWDSGATSGAQASSRRRTRRNQAAAAGKFTADDATNTMYVVCTASEWNETYRPAIERLDVPEVAPQSTVIPLTYLDAQSVIDRLNVLFGGAKGRTGTEAPTFMSVAEGLMVVDATDAQIELIKNLVSRIDIDLVEQGFEQKRTFVLEHADPASVIETVQSLIGTVEAPRKRGDPPAADAARFVPYQDSIIVWASRLQMEEIAALIEELDVAAPINEMRSYQFEPGTNVVDLAETLRQFFPNAARFGRAPARPRGRTRAAAKAAEIAAAQQSGVDVAFVPQPESRRIVISAPADLFPEIERTIDMLRPDAPGSQEITVEFFSVTNGDPAAIAQMVQPIIEMKMDEMIATGEIPQSEESKTPPLNIVADSSASRIVAAAPKALLPEIGKLIADIDAGIVDPVEVRKIDLVKADAEDMVATISAMLDGRSTGATRSAARRQAPRRRGRPRQEQTAAQTPAPTAVASASSEKVTIVTAPGGNSVVITGAPAELDEVERWIKLLDEETPDDRELKVFQLKTADVEKIADEIMSILDAAGGGGAKAAPVEDDFGFSDFSFGGPRVGPEISLTTDPFNNTMIVWATPRKMRQVERWIELYESQTVPAPEPLPSILIKLQHADAFDAVYTLEDYIDAIWSTDKPKVDYIPFENTLVVKAKKQEDLERVRDIVAESIDVPGEGADELAIRTVTIPKGVPSDLALKALMTQLGDFEVEVEGLKPDNDVNRLRRLGPAPECVLPAAFGQRIAELTTAAAALQSSSQPQEQQQPVDADEMIRRAIEGLEQVEPEATDDDAEPQERPKVKLRLDPLTGSITIEGATRDVSAVRRKIDRLVEDLKPARELPDIRVYQLQHIDPNIAAQVLESMFNAQQQAAGRMTPAQLRKQQQQMQQMQKQMQQAMQQAAKAGQAAPQAPVEEEKGGRAEGKEGEGEEESKTESPSTSIRVFPYPSLRAIIINAQTEMYPVIEELVATIDKKHDPTTDYEFFPLKNLLASEVEQILKIMLGLDQQQQQAASRRGQPARGAQADPAVQAVAELMRAQMNLPMVGEESASISSAQTITITSNDITNTVLAVAPGSILDLVKKIIDDLESQPIPVIEQRRFQLKFADASVVVPVLEQLFAPSTQQPRGGGRGGTSGPTTTFNPHEVSQYVKFVADVAGNAVFVRGIESDFVKIQPVIDRMDIETGSGEVITVQIANGNAVEVARTLEAMYSDAATRGSRGAARVKLVGDASSNIIFVRAPEDLREEIKQRIVDMDQSTTPRPRIIELANADPKHVADTIEASFEANRRTGRSRIKVTPDAATQRLMVLCPEELFADIESMAKMLDVPSDVDVKIYKLEHAKAPEIFQSMTQLVQQAMQRMGPGSGSGAKIEPFAATAVEHNNSIVVMGGPRTQLMVGSVLEQLDTPSPPSPGGPGTSVRVLSLKYADPDSAVRSLREIFTSGGRRGDRDISISSPQGSNAIIVRSTESEYNEIERIVKELDVLPGDADRSVRMFALEHTDAAEMQSIIEDYLAKPGARTARGGQQQLVGDIRISSVQGSNSLVVTGEEESLKRVADLVERIDVQMEGATSSPAIVRIIHGNAVEIARTLEAMYGEPVSRGRRGAQSAARVKLVGDASTNVIFVRAPDDLRAEITQRIEDMDESASSRPRIIQLENADPVHVATTIEASFEGSRRAGRSRIKVTPDAASNRLMVLCPEELFEDIESMAHMLDVPTAGDVRVINLKYAEPDAAVRSLREIFGATGRRSAQDISISSPQGSNALIIRSNEAEFAEIARIVEQLDVLPDDTDRSVRMFVLKHTDATEMQAIVEDYLSKPGGRPGRGGQQQLVGDIRVSPVQSSNALVVTGEEESLNRVADLVQRIDVQMEESGSAPKIIKLTKAIPSEIEPTLTQMFVDSAQRGGRGGRGPSGGAMVPIIVANDATSSLVVRAGPSDYTLIEKLAQSLDQEEVDPDTGFKLIQVASTYRVEDLAGTIESSIRQAVQPPTQTGRGARQQTQASVQAIPGNNSLLVAGTRKQLEVAEAMVAQIQRTGPQGGRRTILLKPKNMSAEDIERVIESYIGEDNTRRPAPRGGRGRRR